ncbi:glycerol-3-phosphate 1-O-acyltransferase PlsY [Candidatus Omnitrophota bacterium]
MLPIITAIIASYLIGSIPTAYIFVKLIKGDDIRKYGSGNVGATNAMRILGRGPGITVLLLDILKGVAAVVSVGGALAMRTSLLPAESLWLITGLACICGHNWPVFLRFKGGKGFAATLGIFLGLGIKIPGLLPIFAMIILTWLAVFILTKIVSLASIVTAIALPLYSALFKESMALIAASILLCALLVIRHTANIKRLFKGTEPKISFRK